jgi:hypothetical protein
LHFDKLSSSTVVTDCLFVEEVEEEEEEEEEGEEEGEEEKEEEEEEEEEEKVDMICSAAPY